MSTALPAPDSPAPGSAAPGSAHASSTLATRTSGLDEIMARPLNDAELDAATRDMAAPLELTVGSRRSLLVFRCGGELLAVESVSVARVVPAAPIHRVPHRTSPVFRGICAHDGEVMLCASLEHALGLPPAPEDGGRVLVVIGGVRDRWSFLVDGIVGVLEVPEAALATAPLTVTQARGGCVTHLAETAEGRTSVLDAQRLGSLFRGAAS